MKKDSKAKATIELPPEFDPNIPITGFYLQSGRVVVSLINGSAEVSEEVSFDANFIEGHMVLRPGEKSLSCRGTASWQFSGNFSTLRFGQATIELNPIWECAISEMWSSALRGKVFMFVNTLSNLSSFTATANSEDPVFLTYQVETKDIETEFYPHKEIKIHVRSWTASGEVAPFVKFGWNANVDGVHTIKL